MGSGPLSRVLAGEGQGGGCAYDRGHVSARAPTLTFPRRTGRGDRRDARARSASGLLLPFHGLCQPDPPPLTGNGVFTPRTRQPFFPCRLPAARANVRSSRANGAAARANVTFARANVAFARANVAFARANVAFARGNGALARGNASSARANVPFARVPAAFSRANAAPPRALAARARASDRVRTAEEGMNPPSPPRHSTPPAPRLPCSQTVQGRAGTARRDINI
jgi:hypothetical protein